MSVPPRESDEQFSARMRDVQAAALAAEGAQAHERQRDIDAAIERCVERATTNILAVLAQRAPDEDQWISDHVKQLLSTEVVHVSVRGVDALSPREDDDHSKPRLLVMIGERIEQRLVERESRFKVKVKRHQRQKDWATLSITADHIVATPKEPSDYTMMVTDQPENGKSSVDQTTVWIGCDLTAIPE